MSQVSHSSGVMRTEFEAMLIPPILRNRSTARPTYSRLLSLQGKFLIIL